LIYKGNEPITPDDTNAWHDQSLLHITHQIRESMLNAEKNCLILTHHTPSMLGTSEAQYEGPIQNAMNHAFSTSLEYLFRNFGRENNSNIHTWCFGHTHFTSKQTQHGTIVMSNQLGYRGAKTTYSPTQVVEVPLC